MGIKREDVTIAPQLPGTSEEVWHGTVVVSEVLYVWYATFEWIWIDGIRFVWDSVSVKIAVQYAAIDFELKKERDNG